MTQNTSTPAGQLGCRVLLLGSDEAPAKVRSAFQADEEREGRVRNITRAVAASPATWQTTARASHMFVTLKRVDARTCALLCLYTSMINGCRYCIDDAAGAAFENGVTLQEMLTLPDRAISASQGEKLNALLRFAERAVAAPTEIPDEAVAELKAHVDDETLLEITAVIAMKCFWNYFASILRIPPEGRCDAHSFHSLCDLSDSVRSRLESQ
jgi:AhpD family alkylhydroperoxidase